MSKDVEFIATIEDAGVVWNAPDGRPAKDHKTQIDRGARPEMIDIKLKDRTGLGLQFDPSAPIDVWEQPGCPPAGLNTDQIEIVGCNANKLTIRDQNTGPERTLQYQLNVVAKDGSAHRCDPIIKNGGGGPGVA